MPNFLVRISEHWVRTALSDFDLFCDTPPKWKNLPSRLDAYKEREARVRLLKKNDAYRLSQKIAACTLRAPCLSGACPACTRALQRHLVNQARQILRPASDFVAVSLVPIAFVSPGALSDFSIADFKKTLSATLAHCRIGFGIGGVDFSYNESLRNDFSQHWSPHVWFLTDKYNRDRWEVRLRTSFARSPANPRPIKIQDWDGKMGAIGYSLKYDFKRRISTSALRGPGSRLCNVTQYDRLRSRERFELYSYLHQIGLGSRFFLMGVDVGDPPHMTLSESD